VVHKFRDRGFVRIRSDEFRHQYLLAFSCKSRWFLTLLQMRLLIGRRTTLPKSRRPAKRRLAGQCAPKPAKRA
jgi:hypothetical protein